MIKKRDAENLMIEWGMFLRSHRDYDQDGVPLDRNRMRALVNLVEIVEIARKLNKNTVPISSVRRALLDGWHDRQSLDTTGDDAVDAEIEPEDELDSGELGKEHWRPRIQSLDSEHDDSGDPSEDGVPGNEDQDREIRL